MNMKVLNLSLVLGLLLSVTAFADPGPMTSTSEYRDGTVKCPLIAAAERKAAAEAAAAQQSQQSSAPANAASAI
jgi:hypothetical protein